MKCVIFDLDGVIIHTERQTFNFYKREFAEHGIILDEDDFNAKFGRKSVDFFMQIKKKYAQAASIDTTAMIERKRDAFSSNVKKHVSLAPKAHHVLESLCRAGYTLSLASQNERRMIEAVLDEFALRHYFKVTLSLQDIERKKPNPEIYSKCLALLGASAQDAIVIEDSPDGIGSAKNAGMRVIAVNSSGKRELLMEADYVAESLSEITPEFLESIST